MEWYPRLYIGDKVKNPDKTIKKLNRHAKFLNVYVLTLSNNPSDQLNIFKAGELSQRYYKNNPPYVIGIAADYEEAVALVEKIAVETLNETGDCRIKDYILSTINE